MDPRDSADLPVDALSISIDVLPTTLEGPAREVRGPVVSPFRASLHRFRREKSATTALLILIGVCLVSIILPPIYQHIGPPLHEQIVPGYVVTIPTTLYRSAEFTDAQHMTEYPNALHWLGTDDLGADILARLLKGWQVTLIVVLIIEIQDVAFGIFFGLLAGYYGGMLDTVLSRFTDLMFAFPGILLLILVASIFGPSFDNFSLLGFSLGPYGRLVLVCLVVGFLAWPQMARYVRAQTLQLKETEYVEAARANGTGNLKIMLRHILPNMTSLIIVAAVLDLTGNIGIEATISFLGLGVQPPGVGLGLMVEQYAEYLQAFGYEMLWPLLGVIVLVLTCSFVGNGLEAAFDPREKDYGF